MNKTNAEKVVELVKAMGGKATIFTMDGNDYCVTLGHGYTIHALARAEDFAAAVADRANSYFEFKVKPECYAMSTKVCVNLVAA